MIIPVEPHLLQGNISAELVGDGLLPWRIPYQQKHLFHNDLIGSARCSSGVRLRFSTDAQSVVLHFEAIGPTCKMDLVSEGQLLKRVQIAENAESAEFELSEGHELYEIYLPQQHQIILKHLELSQATRFGTAPDRRLKWIHYGSSISQCVAASGPAEIWPVIVARQHNLNLTNLGLSGQCHLDGQIGRVIAAQMPDIITLKMGINVYGIGSLNARSYLPAALNLITTIRESHPTTPIGVITSIHCPDRETNPSKTGMNLEDYREQNRLAVNILSEHGDQHITLYEGTSIFGPEHADLLPDGLHPNGLGYRVMGELMAEKIMPDLLSKIPKP